ncbi:MAG: TetR/AcrR family transcriptional regulator [Acidimicrobiales bacterium]
MIRSIDSPPRDINLAWVHDGPLLPDFEGQTPGKRRILEAGLELFARQGYPGTSIREIGAEAGIRSATLYSHFKSKEEILGELVFLGHDRHHRILVTALLETGDEPTEQLRGVISAHIAAHCRYPKLAIVTNHEFRHLSPEILAPAAALRRQSLDLAAGIVRRGVELGLFRVSNFEATMGTLGYMGLAAAYRLLDHGNDQQPEEIGAAYAVLALRIVGLDTP